MKYSTRLSFASFAELFVVAAVASSRILWLFVPREGVDWKLEYPVKAIIAND